MHIIRDILESLNKKGYNKEVNDPLVLDQQLDNIVQTLLRSTEDISAAIISSVDGLARSKQLAEGMDEHRFAAMSSALLALSDNLVREGNKGNIENVLIEGSNGKIFILHAGPQFLLTVFTRHGANLGMSLAYARQATAQIIALMEALG